LHGKGIPHNMRPVRHGFASTLRVSDFSPGGTISH
jgi:hypothetical protein